MCGCIPQSNTSQPIRAAIKSMPELTYVPISDNYISGRVFKAKLKQARSTKYRGGYNG